MRVAYYTHTAFFEPALCLIRELSRRVDLHVFLEVSAGSWQNAGFDIPYRALPQGLVDADPILRQAVPAGVAAYWQSAASFDLVVHASRRSLHPSAWRTTRGVLRQVRAIGADVLHVDDVDVSPRLAIGLPLSSIPPLVLSVHDPQPHSGEQNWRKDLARRLAFPRARRFVLYNSASRDGFVSRYGVPPGQVDVAKFGAYDVLREWGDGAPLAPGGPAVVFFGRLSAYKGLDIFFDAARTIATRVPGTRFVVTGQPVAGYEPPPPPDLAHGATVDVISRYMPNAELARLLQQATVVVCPYRDATQSGVVMTAFAFGVPVVASDAGSLPEYVRHGQTGLIVPAGNASALAESVTRILVDRALNTALRQGVAARRGIVGWNEAAETLEGSYRAAVG